MLYNFNGTLINVADIVYVSPTKGQRAEYPFMLTVALRNGQQFAVSYRDEASRRKETYDIARAFERSIPEPVSRYEIESIVQKFADKIRNDIRPIKKFVKDGEARE